MTVLSTFLNKQLAPPPPPFNSLFTSSLAAGTKPPTPLHSLHSGEDVLASYIRSFYPSAPLWVSALTRDTCYFFFFPNKFSSLTLALSIILSSLSQGSAAGFYSQWAGTTFPADIQSIPRCSGLPGGPAAPAWQWVFFCFCLCVTQSRSIIGFHEWSFSAGTPRVVSSVPVMTSLQSGPALDPWLSELHRGVSAFDIRRVAPSFLSQGPEVSDYQEALEQLRLLARCYRDDSRGVMRSSSEEEDDDWSWLARLVSACFVYQPACCQPDAGR